VKRRKKIKRLFTFPENAFRESEFPYPLKDAPMRPGKDTNNKKEK
jgi:hypothetical protein